MHRAVPQVHLRAVLSQVPAPGHSARVLCVVPGSTHQMLPGARRDHTHRLSRAAGKASLQRIGIVATGSPSGLCRGLEFRAERGMHVLFQSGDACHSGSVEAFLASLSCLCVDCACALSPQCIGQCLAGADGSLRGSSDQLVTTGNPTIYSLLPSHDTFRSLFDAVLVRSGRGSASDKAQK